MWRFRNLVSGYIAILLVVILLWPVLLKSVGHNALYVLLNKGYVTSTNHDEWFVWASHVSELTGGCNLDSTEATAMVILRLDQCYGRHFLPVHIITNTLHLSADILATGSSRSNIGTTPGAVTLFGVGHVQSRSFFLSDEVETWNISVHAKHDAPPPVILEVWLDDRLIGNLVYDKGDNSWETLSLSAQITPGFHNFHLWYVNDFFDLEQGLDRNAYIEYVHITR